MAMSRDRRAREEARHVTLVEGVVGAGDREALRRLEQLAVLGYSTGAYDPRAELRGVEIHDRERACPGVNFYSSRIRTGARLVDNDAVQQDATR